MHEKLRENIGAKAVKFRHPCIFNKKLSLFLENLE